MENAFFGFPNAPQELVDNIQAGIDQYRRWSGTTTIQAWTDLDGASTPIIADILRQIRDTEASYFDITEHNQNVFYELGYATGLCKPVFLTINDAIKHAMRKQIDLGILDTHRLKRYRSGLDLANILLDTREPYQHATGTHIIDQRQPLYFQHHLAKIEFATSYFAYVKGQRLGLRQYDPEEESRLPLDRAYREVSSSAGVFLSLLPPTITGSEEHNLRAFLLAGIAEACEVPFVIAKYGDFTTAFDLRDRVKSIRDPSDVEAAVVDLLPRVHERLQEPRVAARPIAKSHLINLSLGSSAAENERNQLEQYFLETREFRRTLNGEAQLVIGRKGSGKTAIFWQVRNRLRANRNNLVLDLRPEGYQLRKLSEIIASHFTKATHDHTMTLFWEYVLYLELAHKIIEDDRTVYGRDRRITDKYIALSDTYENVDEFREGDFSERLLRLVNRLRHDVAPEIQEDTGKILTAPQISQLIYRTDFPKLRDQVTDYLSLKSSTIILVDNLDRGWTAAGVTESDIRIVQCLLNAGRKISRESNRSDVIISSVVFIRDDVFVWLVDHASDRGKESTVRVQWRDGALLKQLVERRLESASIDLRIEPALRWDDIAEHDEDGSCLLDYLVNHCLRRPRTLLDTIELSLSNAALAGRSQISPEDVRRAVTTYSTDMLRDLNFEVRDVFPDADKIIYNFAQQNVRLDKRNVVRIANRQLKNLENSEHFVRLMLWFGFFGVVGPENIESYVFDHGDDLELLMSHAGKSENPILCIHPLFREALSLSEDLLL